MSKPGRNTEGKFAARKSTRVILAAWIGSLISLALMLALARAVTSDIGSFRSCNSNTSTLSISSCGKQSLNAGDFILFGLFILATILTISLFTAAWHYSRGREI